MRIAIIGPVPPYKGGISQYTATLADQLGADDEVLVVTWKHQYPSWLYPGGGQTSSDEPEEIRADTLHLLDYRNPLSWVRAVHAIRAWEADQVLFTWATTFVTPIYLTLVALLRLGWRRSPTLVSVCHNVLPHELRPLDRSMTRLILDQMDACIVHSSSELTAIRSVAPSTHAIKLYLPEYNVPYNSLQLGHNLREHFGLQDRVILFFGLVRPYKGLRFLLQAMPMVLEHLELHLLIAGEFWEDKHSYLELIRQHNIREYVHIQDEYISASELPGYFAVADLVVLPYVDATQSAVIQLAYANGKPVLSCLVGGIPEAVRDGVTGLLVPPRDAASLARAIVRYYEEGLEPTLVAGVKSHRQAYSWSGYLDAVRSLNSVKRKYEW